MPSKRKKPSAKNTPLQREADEFTEDIHAIRDGAVETLKVSDPDSAEYQNADKILRYVSCMFLALSKGEIHVALNRAMLIGMLFERVAEFTSLYPLSRREAKRAAKQQNAANDQKTARQNRVNLAHAMWAKFAPRVKSKTIKATTAHKKIGKIIARCLKLADPIKPETVRDYLKERISGEG